jgi:hypothetical protein
VQSWNANLRHAFEILLGRPLDALDPDATYALYHRDEQLDEEFFRGLTAAELRQPESRPRSDAAQLYRPLSDVTGTELAWFRYGIDPGRSLVLVPATEGGDDGSWPPQDVASVIAAVSVPLAGPGECALWGTAFGTIVDACDIDLNALYEDLEYGPGLGVLARVQTDGSLFDALRAATWTMNGPDFLDPLGDVKLEQLRWPPAERIVVEPRWDEALRAVRHDDLRDHLRRLCLRGYWAASEGGHYWGAVCPDGRFEGLARLARQVIAGWGYGQGQAASVILQLR